MMVIYRICYDGLKIVRVGDAKRGHRRHRHSQWWYKKGKSSCEHFCFALVVCYDSYVMMDRLPNEYYWWHRLCFAISSLAISCLATCVRPFTTKCEIRDNVTRISCLKNWLVNFRLWREHTVLYHTVVPENTRYERYRQGVATWNLKKRMHHMPSFNSAAGWFQKLEWNFTLSWNRIGWKPGSLAVFDCCDYDNLFNEINCRILYS